MAGEKADMEEQHKLLHGVLRPGAYHITIYGEQNAGWFKARLTLLPTAKSGIEQAVALGNDVERAHFPLIAVTEPRRYTLAVTNTVGDVYWRVDIKTQLAAEQEAAADTKKGAS